MSEITSEVDVPLYGLEAVYKACYAFLERAFVRLEGEPAGRITVRLRLKPDAPAELAKTLAGEFENELLHQALRTKVAASNQKIREYIVTRALASAEGVAVGQAPAAAAAPPPADVLDEDLEKEIEKLLAEVEREGGEDPLKIAVPWEEKKASGRKGGGK